MFENIDSLVSLLGESYYIVIPMVVAYLFYRKDKKVYPLLLSVILTILIVTAVKIMVVEPRPCVYFGSAIGCDDPMESFPSRHAAVIAVPLLFLLSRKWCALAYLGYLALIGFTRVYFSQHYLHDVVIGALIGLAIAYVCLKAWPTITRGFGSCHTNCHKRG